MTILYSKTTRGFYDPSECKSIPQDAVVITDLLHKTLMDGQTEGKIITAGQDGVPFLAEPQPLSLDQLKTAKHNAIQVEKCRVRDAGIMVNGVLFDTDTAARLAYIELGMQLSQDQTFTTAWKASEGSWATMNATLYGQVTAAGKTMLQSVFSWQAQQDALVDAATTSGEVAAISTVYE